MPNRRKKPSGPDTIPGMPAIPTEVLERLRRDSSHPEAINADSVRREIVRNAIGPSAVECPTCRGVGVVSEETARHLRGYADTSLLPPPLPSDAEMSTDEGGTCFVEVDAER